MDFLLTGFLYWLSTLFFPKPSPAPVFASDVKKKSNSKNEDLEAFYFGTYPLEEKDNSQPIIEEYDTDPNW